MNGREKTRPRFSVYGRVCTRLLTTVLYHTRPNDPIIFALVGGALAAVALGTGYVAVSRISSIQPRTVLRRE